MGKPLLMVPVHIEQCCNAYDAVRVGAGIAAEDFDLGRLLDFSITYKPNPAFRDWVKSAEWRILRRVHCVCPAACCPDKLHFYSSYWHSCFANDGLLVNELIYVAKNETGTDGCFN